MMIRCHRFNIYLLLALALASLCGCRTTDSKKQISTLRVYLEANRDGTDRTRPVPVYRDNPFLVTVESAPFLTEALITEARVIDTVGGFAIRVQFERRGTWLLEQYSTANRGKRLVIYSEFSDAPGSKKGKVRYLAAPRMTQRISDGALLFTPDCTRDEANQIVLGLNNVARKTEEKYKW